MEATAWDPEGVDTLLDTQGRLKDSSAVDGIDVKALYRALVNARCLDLRLGRLNLPMWAPSAGEEAPLVCVGLLADAQGLGFPPVHATPLWP